MPGYKKKRAQLQQDRFRDAAMSLLDRFGESLEGRGRAIVYGIAGLIAVAALVGFLIKWSSRKTDEARMALGRAISIATTPVSSPSPSAEPTGPSFANEQERAQKAIDEFQKVAAKYGDPYRTEARYFIATSLLYVDRGKGIAELADLSKNNDQDVAILARFALAQAKEADGKLDDAAALYGEVARLNSAVVTPDTGNLFLARVYKKQGKRKEAADLLFGIVEAARKAKDGDGAPMPQSAAARDAAQELQKLDPERFAQLPPEAPADSLF